jgi:hypothetical protein
VPSRCYDGEMSSGSERAHFTVEPTGVSGGHCDCCGRESRCVWGFVHGDGSTVAAYWVRWTVNHLSETGAHLDLVIGGWGDDTTATDRFAVSLIHREQPSGPGLMVIDADNSSVVSDGIAAVGLAREDVIGTSLADLVFSITDAIYEQDGRFF